MKIIELLQKIANGEEVPKKIRYDGRDMFWCEPCKIYEVAEEGELCGKDLYNILDNLNEEVEIIEEDKKIEKLNNIPINYADDRKPEEVYEYLRCTINNLANVINISNENLFELIDRVNNLEKNQ